MYNVHLQLSHLLILEINFMYMYFIASSVYYIKEKMKICFIIDMLFGTPTGVQLLFTIIPTKTSL